LFGNTGIAFPPARAAKWALPLFLFGAVLCAQDLRSVKSPDGKLEFQIFVALQKPGDYDRIGYRVLLEGKTVLDTSFIGLDMYEQEPLLGEKAGLVGSKMSGEPGVYNSLSAEYLQNGSIGSRIEVETRVWNQGLAFRYHFPQTMAQAEFVLADEDTEFAFPAGACASDGTLISALDPKRRYPLPWIAEERGIGWIAINEIPTPGYPGIHLVTQEKSVLVTRLDRPTPTTPVVFDAATPLTGPWHVVLLGKDRVHVLESPILKQLNR
jgi:hypothetical protein